MDVVIDAEQSVRWAPPEVGWVLIAFKAEFLSNWKESGGRKGGKIIREVFCLCSVRRHNGHTTFVDYN